MKNVVNPYDEDFHCRAKDTEGKCTDTPGAYQDARYPEPTKEVLVSATDGTTVQVNPLRVSAKEEAKASQYKTITELLENLGVLHLFRIATGSLPAPEGAKLATPEPLNPTPEQITRTCLEAHQTLMAANPDNVARFKDVAQFLAEDLKNLEKPS